MRAKVHNAGNYRYPLCPRKLRYAPRWPEGTIRETRNFCRRRFSFRSPLISSLSSSSSRDFLAAASSCAAPRRGSLLEMAPCRIFAKFPARSPITTGRRMKKHLSASGKEVRPASWHLFLRISRRIYYEITRRCGSARWISIRPPTDSYFFFPPFLLCFLSFCARVDEFERFTGWNSSQALNEGSLQ